MKQVLGAGAYSLRQGGIFPYSRFLFSRFLSSSPTFWSYSPSSLGEGNLFFVSTLLMGLTEHIHRATCLPDSSFPLSLTQKNSSRAERLSSLIPPLPPYVLRILSLWRVYWVLVLTLLAVGLLLWFIFVHVYGAFFFSRFLIIIHHFSSLTRFFVLFLTTCDVFHTSFWMCLVDFSQLGS